MSHETHTDANTETTKTQISFSSSFWLVVILVGLFVAALNFIPAMSEKEGHGEKTEATSEKHGEQPAAEHKEMQEQPAPAATTPTAPEHK